MTPLKEVSNQTGLSVAYIRKCIRSLHSILEPYVHRGEHNRVLLDDNGIAILSRIKDLRAKEMSLPEIKKHLEQTLHQSSKVGQTSRQATPKPIEARIDTFFEMQKLLNDAKDKHHTEVQEKEQQIQELIRTNEALAGTLKRLPAPEDYQREQRNKQEAARLLGELEHLTGFLKGKQRKAVIERLKKLLFNK